ncbi:solute carrier family 35 member F6-like isoform X2 [Coccinella septempunctata]|nr:solute carrier family 35 member F6-like isoform X2 [Coccinella septempunctata]XP_044763610.1 solute carrier family 35 member F6-like isoform X2 [Coccinella septempunctata]XP_044763611.1 solute carrier family 35 member F6-like isoform X2 [Coccinella septempunctata]
MFFGMILNLLVFKILYCVFKKESEEKLEEHKLTKGNREFNVLIFWLPALCDMVATSTIYIALNLTYASSYQMLRGAVIIFTALLSYPCFGRVPNWREIFGIFLVIAGLSAVGVSDYLDKQESDDAKATLVIVIGDVMVVAAQFLTATQVILEEKFVVAKEVPPLQAVGWEGIFGFFSSALLLVPLCFIYVGEPFSNNSSGTMEDVVDGFLQMYNNWKILVATIVTVFSIAVYNFCGVTVSKELTSTTRKVLDSLRVVIIWIVSLTLFGQKFQYIQFIGFIILLLGMGFYNDLGCTKMKQKMFPPKQEE